MKNQYKQYYVAYERDDDGDYIASVPAIPGCAVYGKTLKEAYKNVRSATQECLEVRQELKKTLPRETVSPETIRRLSFVRLKEYVKT